MLEMVDVWDVYTATSWTKTMELPLGFQDVFWVHIWQKSTQQNEHDVTESDFNW